MRAGRRRARRGRGRAGGSGHPGGAGPARRRRRDRGRRRRRLRPGPGRGAEPQDRLRPAPPRRLQPPPAGPRLRLAPGAPGKVPGPRTRDACRPLRPAALPGRFQALPERELRRRRRPSPDRLAAPHHRLHPDRGPAPRARLGRDHLLVVPADDRLGADRRGAPPRLDVEAASATPVLLKDDPALVPLETLPGRDHYEFPAARGPAVAVARHRHCTRAGPASNPRRLPTAACRSGPKAR